MHVLIGNHFNFVRKGVNVAASGTPTPASETVAPTCGFSGGDEPPITEALPAYWQNISCVKSASVTNKRGATKTITCPVRGKYIPHKVVGGTVEMMIEIQGQSLDELAAELIFGADVQIANDSRRFVPGDKASLEGWLLLDQYDQDDVWLTRLLLWGELTITAATEAGGEDIVKPKFTFTRLYSEYNAGAFALSGLDD